MALAESWNNSKRQNTANLKYKLSIQNDAQETHQKIKEITDKEKETYRPSGRVPVVREDGKIASRVARKPLCVRINEEAAAILDEASSREERDPWEIPGRMIELGLTNGDGRHLAGVAGIREI
jgi:hypothetical protein